MCTILGYVETDDAKKRSVKDTREQVDDLVRRYEAGEFSKKPENPRFAMFGCDNKLRVWLDSACYGNGEPGYYYVRIGHWPPMSTAYDFPDLIVKKSKLRPDQVEFMEQRRAET